MAQKGNVMNKGLNQSESVDPSIENQRTELVDADVVHMHQSAAQNVQAESVHVDSGAILKAEAETIELRESALALARGGALTAHESAIGVSISERAEMNGSGVLFLVANEISGETRVLIDFRAALVGGAIAGLVCGLIKALAGRDR
jgi:hypothetical protein